MKKNTIFNEHPVLASSFNNLLFLVMTVECAIPMIMGANIGTSLTNTLVSFSQLTDRYGIH